MHQENDVSGEAIIGKSPGIIKLRGQIRQVAARDVPVLVLGETGTGKELVARAIHWQSGRRDRPFIAINCSAIPESLAESILFGYEGGSFSGAFRSGRSGLLENADGGTIFLDEAAEMSPSLQAMMLRTLQNYRVRRLGASTYSQLDLRIISATNCDMREAVSAGSFRGDLFYRLNVVPLGIPPLRERGDDLALLVAYFLKLLSRSDGRAYSVTPELMVRFRRYHWPGNVRELRNFLAYGACFSRDGSIGVELLEDRLGASGLQTKQTPHKDDDALEALLRRHGTSVAGKRAVAAKLGISLATLYRRLKARGA